MRKSSRQPRIKREGLLTECLKRLEYDNVLVITGKSGFGKSCLCQDILKELHFDFDVYILKYPDEWKQVDITQDIQPLIFIDNFGRNSNQQDIELEWNIEEMMEYSKKGKIELLLAVELDVLERMKYQLRDYICFSNQKVVNISSDQWKLSYEEKHRLFDIFYKSQSYKGPKINEDELKYMLNCEPVLGFLVTCHDFFNCSHNELKVIEFFKSSEVDFAERVKDLSENSPKLFALLVTLLFSNSPSLQRDCIPEYKEVCCKLNIAIDEQSDLQSKFQELLSMGLVTPCNDLYTFRCKYVEAEVLLLFANNYEDVILNKCDTSFINRYIRPSTYVKKHGEVCVCLDSKHDSFLSKNIINNIASLSVQQGDSLKDCLNNPALEDSEFFQGILKEIQRILTDADMLGKCRDMLYWTCFYGKYEMTKVLLNYLISSDQMTANVFNKALEHLCDCDFSCEKLLLLFATSPYGHFASPDNILKLIEHSFDIGFTPDCFRLFLSKVTVSYDVICNLISTSVDVSHRNEDKNVGIARIILDHHQSFKLTINEKIDFILKCIDLGVHTNENMLQVVKTTFSHCRGVNNFLNVFERYIETDITHTLCISLLRTWWELNPGNNNIHRIYKHVFVKTMQKEWYPTYIEDETIKSLISDLHVWEFMFILQNALRQEKCIAFTKPLLQGNQFNKDLFVHLLQKMFSGDENYLLYILKLLPTSMSDIYAVDESCEWITSYLHDDTPPSPFSDISRTGSVDYSLWTEPIPHIGANKFSVEENKIIFCLLFPSETLKVNELLYGDIKIYSALIQPTSDLFVSLMSVIGKDVLSNDLYLSVIDNLLSHTGKVKYGILSSFLMDEKVECSVPPETALRLLETAVNLEIPSLIKALFECHKVELSNAFLLQVLIYVNKCDGAFGEQCFRIVKSFVCCGKRTISDYVYWAVIILSSELYFPRSNKYCFQSLFKLLNAEKHKSSQTLQLIVQDKGDVIDPKILTEEKEHKILNVVNKSVQSGALTNVLGHTFMLPLFLSASWKNIKYKQFLDILNAKRRPLNAKRRPLNTSDNIFHSRKYACYLFQNILPLLDQFSVISSYDADCGDKWCKECIMSILESPAVDSVSRETALYLMKGMIHSGLVLDMFNEIESNIWTKLKEYDKLIIARQLIQSELLTKERDHQFLLPLLSSAALKVATNEEFLYSDNTVIRSRLSCDRINPDCKTHKLLHNLLFVVDKLSDISSLDTVYNGKWCTKCVGTLMKSVSVRNVPRGTALYLLKGIIQNSLDTHMYIIRESTVSSKLETHDKIDIWRTPIHPWVLAKASYHDFLFPLLPTAIGKQITNGHYSDTMTVPLEGINNDEISLCSLFYIFLLGADELVFNAGICSDQTLSSKQWCEKCVSSILTSAVKIGSRETALYLMKGISQNGLVLDMYDNIESKICTKLEEHDKRVIIEEFIQSGPLTIEMRHKFLLPLLSSVTWKQSTGNLFLIILKRCGRILEGYSLLCDLFQDILLIVDVLSDIESDNIDSNDTWCVECVKAILMSSVVKSATRGTILYLIKGIIQNNLVIVLRDLLESTILAKLDEYDRRELIIFFLKISTAPCSITGQNHDIILQLLSSASWKQITNEQLFTILASKEKCFTLCHMLPDVLSLVDELNDSDSMNIFDTCEWCKTCVFTILKSSVVSRRTVLYFWKWSFQNGFKNCNNDVIESNIRTKLEEYDILNTVKQLVQSGAYTKASNHDFLLPLLSRATWTQKTNNEFLIYLSRRELFAYGCCSQVPLLHSILLCVDELSDIRSDNKDSLDIWCEDCLREVLTSSVVKSASRETALYLTKGVIENRFWFYMYGATIFTKLEESDKHNILKEYIQLGVLTTSLDHYFLLVLLYSAKWKQMTNEQFLGILAFFDQIDDGWVECDSLPDILLVVDELSDICSDMIDNNQEWCEECLRAVLMSSAVKSASRGTSLYLIEGIIKIDSELTVHGEVCTMYGVMLSNICTNLGDYDKRNLIRKYVQMPRAEDHSFLLPLLQLDKQKHNANEVIDYNTKFVRCRSVFIILLMVDKLHDVDYEDTDYSGEWCEECVETVLKSAVVESVSRKTAMYLMKGIFLNDLKRVISIFIQSPICKKVTVNDIVCFIKDSKNFDFYKLFFEQLSLSENEILYCIQHIINDESTQSGLELNAENDPVTAAILNSKRAKIRSSRIFSDIIKTFLTHDSKDSYRRVLCTLSIESKVTLFDDAIGELLVEALKQMEKSVELIGESFFELKNSCTMLLLAKFIQMFYEENTLSFARTTITNVSQEKRFDLHIHDCPIIAVRITLDQNGQTWSLSVSSMLSKYSEDDSVKALVNLISINDCNIDKMLRMLLDSLSITLCVEKIEILLIAIVEAELNTIKQKDLLNEYEQPAFNTTRIRAVFESKHGRVKVPQTSVIKIIETLIISYVDSSEAICVIADAQLSQGLSYESFRYLLRLTVNTPFIASTEYIQLFTRNMKEAKLTTNDTIELLTDCFNSMDDESKTVITILDLIEEDKEKQIILNEVVMDIIETNGLGNAATLDCLSQTRRFTKDMIATLMTNLVLKLRCTNTQIHVDYEKCSKTHYLLLKLLHVFLSYNATALHDIVLIPIESIHFAVRHSVTIAVSYDINEMFTLSMSLSKKHCNMMCVLFNFQQNPNISRRVLVKVTLKAVEIEKLVNHIVLIMLQNYDKQKLTDEDMSVLMCAIIRRKYGGREEYMESLLSQSLSSHIGERSISEALCVAMSSVRNNEHIVSLILSAAEELNVKLSEDKHGLILETLLECKHKRVAHYTRTALQSSISPEMSDKTFLAAVSTIMNHNLSNRDLLHVLLFHKPTLSQECKASLEGLKQTGRRVEFKRDAVNDSMEINDADEDELLCGNDSVSHEDDTERISHDESAINHIAKDLTDGDKKQTDENDDIIPIDNDSVSIQVDEDQRKKGNDAEMNDDDDDSVLEKIDDNERIIFIDDILTNYS